jgi:hypothetical protein
MKTIGSATGTVRGRRSQAPVVRLALLALAIGSTGLACASSKISNLDAYHELPMNRVVPYPAQEELRKRSFEIVIVERPSVGLDNGLIRTAQAQVKRALEGIAAKSGAAVIDRSLQDLRAIQTEGVLSEFDGQVAEAATGADFALTTRFAVYRYSSIWEKPFKFIWQDPADVAGKPGTCTLKAEVGFDVQLVEIGSNDHVNKTFALEHSAEQTTKDLDPACPVAPVTMAILFETALDEALSCLDIPLGQLLAARGHVTAHRKAPEAERHIYRISLGSAHGMKAGDTVEIRREQRTMSPSGEETRSERVLVLGVVTDQVMPQVSWISLDPGKSTDEILDGDIVRPVFRQGLLESLSGPNCGSILDER